MQHSQRSRLVGAVATAAASVLVLGACSSSGGGENEDDVIRVGIAVGASTPDWQPAQGKVAKALAEERGWETVVLNNNGDGPTALKNVDTFIQRDVDFVLQFQADSSVNPVISQKLGDQGIEVVTYDIAGPGMQFVGIDNTAAGELAGQQLGQYAKDNWNCEIDLVLLGTISAAGDANTLRTEGNVAGVQDLCPEIGDDDVVKYDSDGSVNDAAQAARDALSAHPSASRILTLGVNDGAVVGGLNAAEQLGLGDDVVGWGQDGSLITGGNAPSQLLGSVLYFLEGYPVYAFNEVLDKLAAGEDVPVRDTLEDPAAAAEPCLVTKEQADSIPGLDDRVAALIDAGGEQTATEMFCPGK